LLDISESKLKSLTLENRLVQTVLGPVLDDGPKLCSKEGEFNKRSQKFSAAKSKSQTFEK